MVLETFRKRKSTLVFGANLIGVTPGEHRRQRQGFLKKHLVPSASAGVVKRGQCPFTPTPAFHQQPQSDEQWRRPSGEFDADRDIAMVRQSPSERRPDVADMRGVSRKIQSAE